MKQATWARPGKAHLDYRVADGARYARVPEISGFILVHKADEELSGSDSELKGHRDAGRCTLSLSPAEQDFVRSRSDVAWPRVGDESLKRARPAGRCRNVDKPPLRFCQSSYINRLPFPRCRTDERKGFVTSCQR